MIHREATDETIRIAVVAALATSHRVQQGSFAFLQGIPFPCTTTAMPARNSPFHFDRQVCMNLLRLL